MKGIQFAKICFTTFLVLMFFAFFTTPCMAVPACPEPFEAGQQDGSVLNLKLHGDEFFNWTTKVDDDYVILQNEEGYWKYASQMPDNPSGSSRSQAFSDYALNLYITDVNADQSPPSGAITSSELITMYQESPASSPEYWGFKEWGLEDSGTQASDNGDPENGVVVYPTEPYRSPEKLLVVLIEFSNRKLSTTTSEWQNKFFGTTSSVNSFYLENSNNKFKFQPATGYVSTSVVKVTLTSAHPNPSTTSDPNIRTMVSQALSKVSNNINFKSFDKDGNGRLSSNELHIYLIIAGFEASISGSSSPKIWAHRSSSTGSLFTVDGVGIQAYALNGEMFSTTNPAQIGVACHELGHSLGAPDLYNTIDTSDTNTPYTLSVMDTGSWGRDASSRISGSSPTHFDPWCKMLLNFYKPQTAQGTIALTAPSNTASYKVLKIPISGTSEQYFLVEYRNKTGFDRGLNISHPNSNGGVVFWLIDEGVITYQGGSRVNNLPRKSVMWVQYTTDNPFYPPSSTFSETRSLYYSSPTNYTSTAKKQSGISVSITGTSTIKIKSQEAIVKSVGSLDSPAANQSFSDLIEVIGWYLYSTDDGETDSISRIEVSLDGTNVGNAERYERADIKSNVPGFTDYSKSGFRMNINTFPYDDGAHTLTVSIFNNSGVAVNTFTRNFSIHKPVIDPKPISSHTTTVSAGEEHAVIIKEDGSVWTWGINDYGQLGNGTTQASSVPHKILDSGAASVSAGNYHTMILKQDGSLWAFGRNSHGQLGTGFTDNAYSPTHIMDNVTYVSAGGYHTMVIKSDGSLWTFGNNHNGQLGDGTDVYRYSPVKVMDGVSYVSSGRYYSMAVKNDGSLWGWGYNSNGQLGDGTTDEKYFPVHITDNVISVSACNNYTAVVKNDGSLWTWGRNLGGTLGDGTTADRPSPAQVMSGVQAVSINAYHSVALKADGSLWGFGWNEYGQLGFDGLTSYEKSPVYITGGIMTVATGYEFTLAAKFDGTLWAFGKNNHSQLGLGTNEDVITPTFVTSGIKPPGDLDIQDESKHTGCLDYPSDGQSFNGTIQVSGWYFYTRDGVEDAITGVEVLINGASVGMADRYYRPDVAAAITDFGDASKCGFALDIPYAEGSHTVDVRILGEGGKLINEFSRVVTVTSPQESKPFLMTIDSPTEGEGVAGSLTVTGWALYSTDGSTDGISSVQVSVNGNIYSSERFYRGDVAAAVNGYGDYSNCGYKSTIDISGLPTGLTTVTVTAYATDGTYSSKSVEVNISTQVAKPLLVTIDSPVNGAVVSGSLDISGWALYTDDGESNKIASIQIILNDITYTAERFYRKDVADAVPGYGDYSSCGFKNTIDISGLPNGEAAVMVIVIDKSWTVHAFNVTVNIQNN